MSIKFNESKGWYEVAYSKRHPVTRMPVALRRRGFKSLAEAKRAEHVLIAEVHDRMKEKRIPRWREALAAYLEAAKERGLTANTLVCYESIARTFAEKWNERRIDEITTQEIRELVKGDAGGHSLHHQRSVLKVLRGVFEHAVESDSIKRNPVPQIHFPKRQKLKSVLTKEQARILLEKAKELNWDWYFHYAVALYTGMRSGELYALTWDKVNLEDRQIKVDASWNCNDGFKSTKSGDDRIVEIAPPLLTVLRELKLQTGSSDFVLPRLWKWDKGMQAAELRKFLIGIGLPPLRFHDLRASWATLLMSQGVEPIRVMALGGWRDLKTMQVYIRKAGVDIKGSTDNLVLHNPSRETAKVLKLSAL